MIQESGRIPESCVLNLESRSEAKPLLAVQFQQPPLQIIRIKPQLEEIKFVGNGEVKNLTLALLVDVDKINLVDIVAAMIPFNRMRHGLGPAEGRQYIHRIVIFLMSHGEAPERGDSRIKIQDSGIRSIGFMNLGS